jgi:hypothetical protein
VDTFLFLRRGSADVVSESLFPKLLYMLDYFVQRQSGQNAARIVELLSTQAANPFLTNFN